MSYYGGQPAPQTPMQINPALHQAMLQLIAGLTQQVPPNVKQVLSDQLANNQGLVGNLHDFIYKAAAQKGININTTGIHQSDLEGLLHAWTDNALELIYKQMGIQRQRAIPHNVMGGMIPNAGPTAGLGAMYSGSSGGFAAANPIIMPTPVSPTQTTAPQSPQLEAQLMPAHKLVFNRDGNDDDYSMDKTRGLELIGAPQSADWEHGRVTIFDMKSRRVANDAFEAYRETEHLLPLAMKRGYWTHRLLYTQLGHINLDTKVVLGLRDKIRARYPTDSWRGVVEVLQDTTQGVWSRVDAYLTQRINTELYSRLRSEHSLSTVLSIQSIVDLQELVDPHFKSPVADHPAFAVVMENLIDGVMTQTFIQDAIVSDNVTPLLKCRAVDYFKGRTTKYDYGMLPPDERDAMLADIRSNNTIIETPRCLAATNALPPGEINLLQDPTYMLPPGGQGVFGEMLVNILTDRKPTPDIIVLNRYRVAPSDWLNIIKPVYPMGENAVYLVGNNKQNGW